MRIHARPHLPEASDEDRKAMTAGQRAADNLPQVTQYRYVPERRALRLELADGVALELPLDTAEGFQGLSDAQRAAITVGPWDKVEHEATDQGRHLSEWLASHPQLVRLSRSIAAWRQAVRYGNRPLPVRASPSGKVSWERLPPSFRRRVAPLLRDPEAGEALPSPETTRVFTDPVSGIKVLFQRESGQVTVVSALTPSEQVKLWGPSAVP